MRATPLPKRLHKDLHWGVGWWGGGVASPTPCTLLCHAQSCEHYIMHSTYHKTGTAKGRMATGA